MAGPDDPHHQEAEDPELTTKRAAVLDHFLLQKPWEKSLEDRHQVYLTLRAEDIPPEDLGEYTASLVTGLPHVGRQGYTGKDKPPFDLASPDGLLLVDAKVFDSGKSKAQHRLKVKPERPRKQFRRWSDEGEKAIPCQLAGGRKGWFLVPGIPWKDVPLDPRVTTDVDDEDLLKPIPLLDKRDLSDWNDFQELARNWRRALEHLRKHEGAFMGRLRQEKEKFGEKEAAETLAREWERNIWIDKALEIPEAKERIVEQVFDDDAVMRAQLGEELFLLWKARQQARAATNPSPGDPPAAQAQSEPAKKRRNGRKNP